MNEDHSPFPYASILSVRSGIFAFYAFYTSVFPVAAFMVVDFGVAKNVDTAGYFAGWIGGIFMLGRLLSAIPYGYAADHWGRKPCLVISMLSEALFSILFGFSTSYPSALITRGLSGFGNGFMTILPIVLTELVDDKQHELRAFGYANTANSSGFLIGSVLGGLLYKSAIQYPRVFSGDSIWGRYPCLLPNMMCSVLALLAAGLIWTFVPESRDRNKSPTTDTLSEMIVLSRSNSFVHYGSLPTVPDTEAIPRGSW